MTSVFDTQEFNSRLFYPDDRTSPPPPGARDLYPEVAPGVRLHLRLHERASSTVMILSGYLLSQFFPDTFSGSQNSFVFMALFSVAFSFGVAYIAYRGVTGTTGVNMAINAIQITALIVFSVMAIAYRTSHPEGSTGFHLSNGIAVDYVVAQEAVMENGKPKLDPTGAPVMADKLDEKSGMPVPEMKDGKPVPFTLSYAKDLATTMEPADPAKPTENLAPHFQFHSTASSVVSPQGTSYIFIQACIAILILVGFE